MKLKEMLKKMLKNRKILDVLIIIFVTCLIGIPLFNSKLNVYFDDGIQHIARAYGTQEALKENLLFPNVISSFSNGYGYSWNLFYGPLSTLGIVLINLITQNYIIAYKIFIVICMALSGYFMYKFVERISGNNDVGLLASILYMTFPYHLTDMYTRNALGEYVSFIFIPIVFLGLYKLVFEKEKDYHLAFGAIGLILTHNLSTMIVAIFSIIYLIVNFQKVKEKEVLKNLFINIIFIVLITSFYWIPLLETKLSADYQVYEDGMMSTPEQTAGHGLELKQLFATQNDGSYVFELGPHILIMMAISLMTFRVMRKEFKGQYILFLIAGIVTLWMSTKYFPWKYLPQSFSIIQFPWRILMMSAFFLSVVCSINMYAIIKKFSFKDVVVISTISIIYILAFYNILLYYTEEPLADIIYYDIGKFSGREYEVVAGAGKGEYLPVKAYENRFYIASRENVMYVLEGKAIIEKEEKTNLKYNAKIKTLDAEYTIFELPYIYYPGYEVKIDGITIDNFETENGFLGFVIGKEEAGNIEVKYVGTSSMKYAMFISVITFIAFLLIIKARKNGDKVVKKTAEVKTENDKTENVEEKS